MKLKNKAKRGVSLLLSIAMCASVLQTVAFADAGADATGEPSTSQSETDDGQGDTDEAQTDDNIDGSGKNESAEQEEITEEVVTEEEAVEEGTEEVVVEESAGGAIEEPEEEIAALSLDGAAGEENTDVEEEPAAQSEDSAEEGEEQASVAEVPVTVPSDGVEVEVKPDNVPVEKPVPMTGADRAKALGYDVTGFTEVLGKDGSGTGVWKKSGKNAQGQDVVTTLTPEYDADGNLIKLTESEQTVVAAEETPEASKTTVSTATTTTEIKTDSATITVTMSEVTDNNKKEDKKVDQNQDDSAIEKKAQELWNEKDENGEYKYRSWSGSQTAYNAEEHLRLQVYDPATINKLNFNNGWAGTEGEYGYTNIAISSMIGAVMKEATGETHNDCANLLVVRGKADAQGKRTKRYAYCADMSVGGTDYYTYYKEEDVLSLDDTRLSGDAKEAAQKLKMAAEYGSWYGKSGGNNADTFANWIMSDCGYDGKVELTEGEAIELTQALMWYYGNSGNTKIQNTAAPFSTELLPATGQAYDPTKLNNIFNYLINGTDGKQSGLDKALAVTTEANQKGKGATSLLDTSVIQSADVTVNSKSGKIITTKDCDDVDVSLNLHLAYRKDTDDLFITVKDSNGKAVQVYRISGVSKENEKTDDGIAIEPLDIGEDGTVRLTGIDMSNGKVTLQLSGTQYYNKNATVLTGVKKSGTDINYSNTQSLITVDSYEHYIDMSVDLTLDVTPAEVQTTEKTEVEDIIIPHFPDRPDKDKDDDKPKKPDNTPELPPVIPAETPVTSPPAAETPAAPVPAEPVPAETVPAAEAPAAPAPAAAKPAAPARPALPQTGAPVLECVSLAAAGLALSLGSLFGKGKHERK